MSTLVFAEGWWGFGGGWGTGVKNWVCFLSGERIFTSRRCYPGSKEGASSATSSG